MKLRHLGFTPGAKHLRCNAVQESGRSLHIAISPGSQEDL